MLPLGGRFGVRVTATVTVKVRVRVRLRVMVRITVSGAVITHRDCLALVGRLVRRNSRMKGTYQLE